MLTLLFVSLLLVTAVLVRPALRAFHEIKVDWKAAGPHIVATLTGLMAFAILFALLQVFNLLESETLTIGRVLQVLQLSLVVFLAGCSAMAGLLMLCKKN